MKKGTFEDVLELIPKAASNTTSTRLVLNGVCVDGPETSKSNRFKASIHSWQPFSLPIELFKDFAPSTFFTPRPHEN